MLFTSTVCPYANYFAVARARAVRAYGPRGVLFVGVNSNNWESREEIVEHAREHGFAFPMIKDEGHVIADRLGARIARRRPSWWTRRAGCATGAG